jgi:large subunit ribosomal protein L3
MKTLIATKLGMISALTPDTGELVAVTLLKTEPGVVTQLKSTEKDGYNAVQVGWGKGKPSKSLAGHLKPSKAEPKLIREVRVDELSEEMSVGTKVTADVFEVGDNVSVTAKSKGKGWAGTIKRHNFHRQRKTHGGKGDTRKVGSIGSMYPQHIRKGKKMAGRMGHTNVTVSGLKVALVEAEKGVIGITGAVPGPRRGLVVIKGVSK